MSKKNIIITKEFDQLLYMGEDLYSGVMKTKPARPFCYASGRIKYGDIFLTVFAKMESLSQREKRQLEEKISEPIPLSGAAIIIGAFEDDDVKPLIKGIQMTADGQNVWVETIFHGMYLKLQQWGKEIRLETDSQTVTLSLEDGAAAVILNEQGVVYFTAKNQGTQEKIMDLLSGSFFEGYWDEMYTRTSKIDVAETLREEFIQEAKKLDSQDEEGSIFQIGQVRYYVQRIVFSSDQPRTLLWIVMSEFDILRELSRQSEAYDTIIRADHRKELTGGYTFGLWGNDPKINRIRFLLQKSAGTNTTILLTGESGTGKSFLAKEIHKCSKRKKGSFVSVNCAAIPYNLIESELFGYEEGAFTGARKGGKAGYFELAEGGTLFLDEITEMPLSLQGKLLEVIQSKTYFRVGGIKKKTADVRIIAATNKDLEQMVREHKFRDDLYYRINVFPVEIPPLRERIDSLYNIVADILPEICERLGVPQQVISQRTMEKMKNYRWPGNIRELENVLEKACILSDGKVILPDDVDLGKNNAIHFTDENRTLKEMREEFEKNVLEEVLKKCGGSRLQAAKRLDISKTSLFEKLKRYGITNGEREE